MPPDDKSKKTPPGHNVIEFFFLSSFQIDKSIETLEKGRAKEFNSSGTSNRLADKKKLELKWE